MLALADMALNAWYLTQHRWSSTLFTVLVNVTVRIPYNGMLIFLWVFGAMFEIMRPIQFVYLYTCTTL